MENKTINFRRNGIKKKGVSTASETSSQSGFDVHQLNQLLESLVPVGDTKIANLKGRDKDTFSKVVRIVENTVGTDYYRYVLESFNSHFDANSIMEPGTVKAYCVGCSAITSMSNSFPTCTPLCAGNAPSSEQSSCQFKTFIARKVDSGFILVLLNPSEGRTDNERALVFVDEKYVSGDEIPFSTSELGTLKEHGITEIKVFSHDSTMRNYRLIGERSFNIGELSHPRNPKPIETHVHANRHVNNNNDTMYIGGGILFALFILLLLLFVGYRRRRKA